MTKLEAKARLIDLHREAAAVAFGWAETYRREREQPFARDKEYSRQEASAWLEKYVSGHPGTDLLAQRPGSPLHLVGLAFRDMTQSAEEWEQWAYRLTAAHDWLCREISA